MKAGHSHRRTESFWLALAFALILALLLSVIGIAVYKSPLMVFRLPEKTQATAP